MLFNPKWIWRKANVKPSLEGFIGWLEVQNPSITYTYMDTDRCLVAQYLASIGGHKITDYFAAQGGTTGSRIAVSTPHTFGAALERARALRDDPEKLSRLRVEWPDVHNLPAGETGR
jgi:hypothetical protein